MPSYFIKVVYRLFSIMNNRKKSELKMCYIIHSFTFKFTHNFFMWHVLWNQHVMRKSFLFLTSVSAVRAKACFCVWSLSDEPLSRWSSPAHLSSDIHFKENWCSLAVPHHEHIQFTCCVKSPGQNLPPTLCHLYLSVTLTSHTSSQRT